MAGRWPSGRSRTGCRHPVGSCSGWARAGAGCGAGRAVGAGAAHAAEYQRSWLASDLMAGLVLTALLVPVGMGYAQAAGLPPISGLYATIVPLVAYAVFGPSRVMVLGPDSSLAAVIVAVILLLRRFWRAVPGVMVTVLVGIAAVADTTVLSQSLAAQRDKTVDPTRSSVPSAPPTWPPACPGLRHLQQRLPHPGGRGRRRPLPLTPGRRCRHRLLLVAAPGALRDLPLTMLAAIVITAAVGLIDVAAVRRLYQVRRSEFVLWLTAFLGVALLGVLFGIFVAILLSLADFVRRAWRPMTPSSAARMSSRATTTSTATPVPASSPACSSTASTRPCSSPTPATSAAASATWSPGPPTPSVGWWSPPSRSPTSTPPPPTTSTSCSRSCARSA